jgi:hypothetical protein
MADWTKVEPANDVMWNWEDEPELVGKFNKVQENIGENNSTLYTFELENGDLVKTWGSTVLDLRLQMVPMDTAVKIVFNGKKKNPKNGREYKDFDVFYKGTSIKKN